MHCYIHMNAFPARSVRNASLDDSETRLFAGKYFSQHFLTTNISSICAVSSINIIN